MKKTPNGAVLRGGLLCAFGLLALCVRGETVTAEPDAFLDYIEATGSQYIDTGVNAETGLKARIDFSWASGNISGNDWSFLDAAIDNTVSDKRTRFLMCHLYGGGGKPYFGYGVKQRKNPEGSFPFVGGQRYEIVTDMTDTNSLQLVQNGKNTFSATDLETFKTNGLVNLNLNLYVFACHLSNKAAWFSKGKLYELKIWKKNAQSGELDLIRHYLPCIKGGRAGLYDKVHGSISYSFSTTPFVAGPVLDKPLDFVKWVWTNGSQWFDTRVWGKSGLKSEVDVSVREYEGDRCILGTRRGNNRYYPAYNYQSAFRYAYGTMPNKGDTTSVVPTNDVSYYMDTRYLIKSDLRDGYQSVLVSKNGGTPVELHKGNQAYLTGENVVTNTMALMACHQDNGYTYPSKGLVYRTTIWDGDELLRDFVPVVATNAEGVAYAGLYDTVTERIYRQIGTEEFDITNQVGAVTNSLRAAAIRPKTRIGYVDSDELLDYIDLGIIGKDGVEMDAMMEWLRVPNDGAFVGAKDSYKTNNRGTAGIRFYPYHYWSGSHRNGYSAELYSLVTNGVTITATAGTKYRIVSLLDAGDQHYSVATTNEVGMWTTLGTVAQHVAGPVDTERPMYLFAVNQDGIPRYPGKVRLYRLKLSVKQQDGTYKLARDLVPVKDPATGAPVLWDNVTESYFRNGGKYLLAGGGRERRFDSGMMIMVK
ncbi:MAG: hypothetical protein IJL17_09200 [Kiritimatiellae bacterium]|nr:hypothetical protein [Kiritimatiellia bacterium]